MTLASKITLARIFLVPVFAVLAVYYGQSVKNGEPDELLRWAAVITFIVAAASDGIDGYLARRMKQRSSFGAILDPIADKALLLTALITLALVEWGGNNWHIPIWFVGLVIARDILILGGICILYFINHHVPIKPHWTGKVCTVTQMVVLGWIMLKWIPLDPIYPTIVAAIFTYWSGHAYFLTGLHQLPESEHQKENNHENSKK